MFKKDGSSSSQSSKKETPLRRSDTRRLLDRFLKEYGSNIFPAKNEQSATEDGNDDDDDDEQRKLRLDSAFGVGAGSSSLILRRKIRMPGGDTVTLYSHGAQSSSSSSSSSSWPYGRTTQALVLEMEDDANRALLVPCLPLLSVVPTCLPTVVIPSEASKFLCRGADLMSAGILDLPPDVRRGAIVSVSARGNPQPFAVGFSTVDAASARIGPGTKGVAVRIVTCYGDDLWRSQAPRQHVAAAAAAAPRSDHDDGLVDDDGHYNNPGFVDGSRVLPIVRNIVDRREEDATEDVDASVEETEENQQRPPPPPPGAENDQDVGGESDGPGPDPKTEQEIQDELLLSCFHNAIMFPSDPPLRLPMPVSVFYAKHVLAARPPGTTLDVKKTTWKKIGTFLQRQADLGVVAVRPSKDKKDKVAFLSDVNKSHPEFRRIKRELKERRGSTENDDDNDDHRPSSSSSSSRKLTLVRLRVVPTRFVSLLRLDEDAVRAADAKSTARRGTGFLTGPEARAILDAYVASNELVDPYDPETVVLDAPLTDALFRGEVAPAQRLTRKELSERWSAALEEAHALVAMPGNEVVTLKRGKPVKVRMEVTRVAKSGKIVTLVRGLEEFRIDGAEFAKDVARRFACSASSSADAGKRAALKKGCVEVTVQGHWLEELTALLYANERLTSHGGAKNSPYYVPKGLIESTVKKGLPKKKKK